LIVAAPKRLVCKKSCGAEYDSSRPASELIHPPARLSTYGRTFRAQRIRRAVRDPLAAQPPGLAAYSVDRSIDVAPRVTPLQATLDRALLIDVRLLRPMCLPKSWLALRRIKQSLASHHCEKLPQADKGYEGQEHAFCKRFGDARGRDPSIRNFKRPGVNT